MHASSVGASSTAGVRIRYDLPAMQSEITGPRNKASVSVQSRLRTVFVLKSGRYCNEGEAGSEVKPYRIDELEKNRFQLAWTDSHMNGRFGNLWIGRLIRRSEGLATPWLQTLLGRRLLRSADVTLAIFESEGHGLAAMRRIGLTSSDAPFVIMSCWLAELAKKGSPSKLRLYKWLYRDVDIVTVFSSNQVATLNELLGIDKERIAVIRFGIDLEELTELVTSDSGRVVAAGRDLGRDWVTLARAAAGSSWEVDLISRTSQIDEVGLPQQVNLIGQVERSEYLRYLAAASVVAIPTEVREYPTGQSVLLEAMALGKACVVTDTPAMREYVDNGRTGILVPPHDSEALRRAIDWLLAEPDRARELGRQARLEAVRQGGAADMWSQVADILDEVIDRGHRDELENHGDDKLCSGTCRRS